MSVLDSLNTMSVIDDLNSSSVLGELTIPQNYVISEPVEPEPPVPVTPICFIAGSKVLTDQGIVEIQKIKESIHTIRNKKIIALTKTKLSQNYLVQIEKDSLYKNVPNETTVLSPNHKIFYGGKMVAAKVLSSCIEGVSKITYNNEYLYNILLEESGKMIVNNIVSETLDPTNVVSLIYTSKYDNKQKNTLIIELNNIIKENNSTKYSRFTTKLMMNNKNRNLLKDIQKLLLADDKPKRIVRRH